MGRKKLKKRKSKTTRKKTLFLTFISLCLIITISYVFSIHFIKIYNIYNEKKQLNIKLSELTEEEDKLKSEVEKLNDPEYIARYAREKFLYSKDGEYIIKIP